jgi:hypothetical protein
LEGPEHPLFNIFGLALVRLVVGEQMTLNVEGDLDPMTHQLLNLLGIVSAFDPQDAQA